MFGVIPYEGHHHDSACGSGVLPPRRSLFLLVEDMQNVDSFDKSRDRSPGKRHWGQTPGSSHHPAGCAAVLITCVVEARCLGRLASTSANRQGSAPVERKVISNWMYMVRAATNRGLKSSLQNPHAYAWGCSVGL